MCPNEIFASLGKRNQYGCINEAQDNFYYPWEKKKTVMALLLFKDYILTFVPVLLHV